MTEYVTFSFRPFEDYRVVSSLLEFLSHADLQYEFKGFEHVVPVIAKEVAVGLKFLHVGGIAHGDLKAANILLSNDHYIHVCGDELEFIWETVLSYASFQISDPNHFLIEGAGTRSRHSHIHVAWNFAAGIKNKLSYPRTT